MQRRNDWICLTYKKIDVRTISWTRYARWICHLCLIKNNYESRDESKKIFDVNKRYFKTIFKFAKWTLITKKTIHETFATLRKKSSNDETTDQEKELKKSSNRKIENRSCLCDRKHLFKDCYYLIEKIRSIEWKSNEEIKKKITKILEANSRLRIAVKYAKEKVKKWLEKEKKIEKNFDDESTQTSKKITLNFSFVKTFVEKKILYKLINCWTLNNEIDIHVCNDSERFQLNRMIDLENQLIIDKIVYDIKSYETMNIVVKKFDDLINIQLLNVALMLEFFINLICLIKMTKKEIYWNIEEKRLHRKEIIFCDVESIENHSILEKNSSIDEWFEIFEIKSKTFKSDLMIMNKE
jgi:regulator of replication initiation timing